MSRLARNIDDAADASMFRSSCETAAPSTPATSNDSERFSQSDESDNVTRTSVAEIGSPATAWFIERLRHRITAARRRRATEQKRSKPSKQRTCAPPSKLSKTSAAARIEAKTSFEGAARAYTRDNDVAPCGALHAPTRTHVTRPKRSAPHAHAQALRYARKAGAAGANQAAKNVCPGLHRTARDEHCDAAVSARPRR